MSDFGITPAGFVVKPFTTILNDKLDLARSVFGPDVDLRSTSALRKILDIVSAEDHEHWKALEGAFYANYVSTGSGAALDLLGDDLGLQRPFQQATGSVTFTLSNEAPGRTYLLPVGTLVETGTGGIQFITTAAVSLSSQQKTTTVAATAVQPGPSGNIAANAITQINLIYAGQSLSLGSASIAATNSLPYTGGDVLADDETYRAQLIRQPRTVFTVQAVSAAVRNVPGVRDCKVSDPLGGVDVSLSIGGSFVFDSRRFGQPRPLGSPYFFDVLVAPQPGYVWDTFGAKQGLHDQVATAIDSIRPIGIFPNIRLANSVVVGVRASITTRPGMDLVAVDAALRQAFEQRVSVLGLGGDVLAAEVISDLLNVSGVVDVQNLHLRRYPPTFATIVFGDQEPLQSAIIEADISANLTLNNSEIATFQYDSQLIDLQVSDR